MRDSTMVGRHQEVQVLSHLRAYSTTYLNIGKRVTNLSGAGVGRQPLAMVVVENPKNIFVFLDLLEFYL
jgi:hypothetical protein